MKNKPDMSVDDMLWWLYDTYKIVVGTRTIRRVFERKGDKVKGSTGSSSNRGSLPGADDSVMQLHDEEEESPTQTVQYQSPYAPMQAAQSAEQQLAQALQQQTPQTPYPTLAASSMDDDLPDDEETIQLQLQQIALQKREVELKLKMRRLQQGKGTPSRKISTPQVPTSTLFNPEVAAQPQPPKRDSRSKKKIEESKKRTAERQERMLRDLERRSRRRDHLTAEWVQSKDIWPLRAQGLLADLMHQYGCYAYGPSSDQTFDAMYRDLYQLVDLSKGDWVPQIHDEMLRERMKRKMGQLRTKMAKTGEIIGRNDAFGGWQKAEDYTGEAAGAAIGDESEIQPDLQQAGAGAAQMPPPPLQPQDDPTAHGLHHPHQQQNPYQQADPHSHHPHQALTSPVPHDQAPHAHPQHPQMHSQYELPPPDHHQQQPPPGMGDPHQHHQAMQPQHPTHGLPYGAPPPTGFGGGAMQGQYAPMMTSHHGMLGYGIDGEGGGGMVM